MAEGVAPLSRPLIYLPNADFSISSPVTPCFLIIPLNIPFNDSVGIILASLPMRSSEILYNQSTSSSNDRFTTWIDFAASPVDAREGSPNLLIKESISVSIVFFNLLFASLTSCSGEEYILSTSLSSAAKKSPDVCFACSSPIPKSLRRFLYDVSRYFAFFRAIPAFGKTPS